MTTHKPHQLLTNIVITSFVLGLIFLGSNNIISNAQSELQKILINTRAKISAPNDKNLDNNEAFTSDFIIKELKPNQSVVIEQPRISPITNLPIVLVSTGNSQFAQQMPLIFLVLLISVNSYLLYQKLKYPYLG